MARVQPSQPLREEQQSQQQQQQQQQRAPIPPQQRLTQQQQQQQQQQQMASAAPSEQMQADGRLARQLHTNSLRQQQRARVRPPLSPTPPTGPPATGPCVTRRMGALGGRAAHTYHISCVALQVQAPENQENQG
jgi:hypothetical protein